MLTLKLDLLQTLTLAAVVYYAGVKLRQRIGILDRLNIPSAVVGGLLFAALVFVLRDRVAEPDARHHARSRCSTSRSSPPSAWARASRCCARAASRWRCSCCSPSSSVSCRTWSAWRSRPGFGESPLLGVMAGSVTLVGGPATGLAFAPLFEEAGLRGRGRHRHHVGRVRHHLRRTGGQSGRHGADPPARARAVVPLARRELASELEFPVDFPVRELVVEVEREDTAIIRNLAVLALAMGLGSVLSHYIQAAGLTLPAYIGAMIVASVLRNLDEATGWFRIDENAMEFVGGVALNIFLVVALMDLKIWQLAGQALPLFVILLAQLVVLILLAYVVSFRLMGRDYDSAVMASGFIGFAMGTTANAVANMRALVGRFGPAPRAFLVIPLVGAFFIDFANALIVTFFVNWLK